MSEILNGVFLLKQLNFIYCDRKTLFITGVFSFLSVGVESLNLYLAIILKVVTIINVIVYLILNSTKIKNKVIKIFKRKK
tara:strand:+ start:771 stop:1010 length:240 start_codon:yes stop_codon:yes gene_type:complete